MRHVGSISAYLGISFRVPGDGHFYVLSGRGLSNSYDGSVLDKMSFWTE